MTLIFLIPCFQAAADYPEIRSLTRDDLFFKQLEDDVETWYRSSLLPEPRDVPEVEFFRYRRKPTEDLFSLNARLNLPYDTLATLNGLESPAEMQKRADILVCSQPGIFIPEPARTELQQLMLESRLMDGKTSRKIVVWQGTMKQAYWFFPGSQFNDTERAYFLQILYRIPIASGRITSRYGQRADPFTGTPEFHGGLDIGAPEGTEVHAAREGTVSERAESSVLGKYIVLRHPGGAETVYGHLSAFNVTLGDVVTAGAVIGRVGSTGQATGPHLHFEVRTKGGTTDPWPLLRIKG